MTMKEAIRLFNNYLQSNHKQRTIDSYVYLFSRFEMTYAERDLDSIGHDEIYTFLEVLTQDLAKSTRRLRYAQLKAFYNFIAFLVQKSFSAMKKYCGAVLLFIQVCQEQIEMSGFVANELSAFSVLQGSLIFEQEVSGGHSLSSVVFRVRSYPQPFSRSPYGV